MNEPKDQATAATKSEKPSSGRSAPPAPTPSPGVTPPGPPPLSPTVARRPIDQEFTGASADARSHYLRGLAAAQNRDFESAVQHFTEAIRIDSDYAEAYVARGCARLYSFNEHDLAIEDHAKAISLQPDYALAYFHRADTYWDEGRNHEALNDCNKAISLAPRFAQAFKLRAQVFEHLEEHERASADLERAQQLGLHEEAPWHPWEDTSWQPWQQVAVVPGGNDRTQIEQVRVDGDQHRDGNAALSEFIPNFAPDDWDENLLEAFRCIVEGVNRLREGPPARKAGKSRPFFFPLNLAWDDWDDDFAELLAQIGHAIEQLRAAMEDGEPLPSGDFVFRFDESIYDDDLVVFVRRIEVVLNGLREAQSPRAIDSQLMLFDLSETQTQDDTSPSKPAEVPSRKDESVWQSLVIAARDSGEHEKAVELAEQAVREYPRSDWLWRELGGELTEVDRLDEAEMALGTAHRLNPKADWLWRRIAVLYRKRKNLEGEIESLETLNSLGVATWHDRILLGIAYHNHRDLAKAVECYRLSAAAKNTSAPWFNLALVYSDPEISQDADAADACRCALSVAPDYAPARELLEKTKRKLAPLATQAKAGADGLVEPDEFFDFYISPFEMLQIEDVTFAAGPDAKAIKRAKERLNAELQLNDGKVSWLDDYSLDKARALAVVDELDDEAKWRYHVAIFRNQPLLNFLTRGDVRHFLYSDDYFPCDTEELLHQEPGFRTFLSEPFAKQYNLVLTRAIEQRRLPVVEVLFDGRRWVEPEGEDLCFDGASKRVGDIVEAMRSKARDGGSRKVSLREMQQFLGEHCLPELFNLLPAHFARYQGDIVDELRNWAISCFNQHGDPVLLKGVLSLCKNFTSRSVRLTRKLEEDLKTIEAMISAERASKITQRVHAKHKHNQEPSNASNLLGFVIVWVLLLSCAGIVGLLDSCKSTRTPPSSRPDAPSVSPSSPVYRPPSTASTSSESRSLYRIPSYLKAELDRESRVIDTEKATAERLESQLEQLGRELERTEAYLDLTSQSEVDDFNPKTMKQDARQFSAEYQLYKRGGGALNTRDYITQMAKQGKLSDDLKAQLEHNYKMDLSDPALAGVEKQDVLSQKPAAAR